MARSGRAGKGQNWAKISIVSNSGCFLVHCSPSNNNRNLTKCLHGAARGHGESGRHQPGRCYSQRATDGAAVWREPCSPTGLLLIFNRLQGKWGEPGKKQMGVFQGTGSRGAMPGLEGSRDSEK